ncbi:hypothetical protein VY88_26515 [Azospirillum thiophilum]|uniref:Uncharacterized protein n=1 Tax=Azospirillum thiophilum TaxID=528244 RepID=A0AAC8ZW55_9PROT|nr:hypothetical protein [Azospirillum thiophilum]ALG75084.1 hypothetical protein AL072_29420 [Azospirillum thiophilum]KJR62478.1 hypothetical protein VY88_26515 [Azospirillum thiophilum]
MTDAKTTLHALLDAYLRCPAEAARTELEQALRSYQTDWIRARAGDDAPPLPAAAATLAPVPAASAARPAVPKPRFPIASADLEVLKRLADGWPGTTAEVARWAWFENRELVTLAPGPAGPDTSGGGPELLRLTPLGWAALGRLPPD